MVRDEDGLRNYGEICLRINYDTFVEVVTNRVFVIVDKFILSDLKKLAHSFGFKWNFCTSRSGKTIKYNRTTRPRSSVNEGLRNVTSIACGCKLDICVLDIIRNKTKILDHVVITTINSAHSNSYDPSYVDQFILFRTRAGDYNRYGNEFLRKIMVQMAIDPFVNVRTVTKLLQKALPGRKDVDRHMINNVGVRARIRIGFKEYSNWL